MEIKDFSWGIKATINGNDYTNKDIIDIENKDKLDQVSDNYENVLKNIDIIKSSSDNFLQSILDNNPNLKNIKEKKNNDEIEPES